MSRLSDILGVKEGQEFRFRERLTTYRINGDVTNFKMDNGYWFEGGMKVFDLCEMIAHPELIRIVPEKQELTEQQITAIKGRIAEGTLWAARDEDREGVWFYPKKPTRNLVDFEGDGNLINSRLYDFITFKNSPIYLPDLIEE